MLLSVVLFFILEKILEKFLGHGAHSHTGDDVELVEEKKHDHAAHKENGGDCKKAENGDGDSLSSTPSLSKNVGYMNLIADGLHNFCDGVAIGASFSSKVSIGISTSLAVLVHEIPQEVCS